MAGPYPLVKTGQLAERARVLPSKVRFYVQQRLLEPVGQMPGGYYLFEASQALERLQIIQKLQEDRLTLPEIKSRLASNQGSRASAVAKEGPNG